MIFELDRIASELETLIDERPLKGDQPDLVNEVEQRFTDAIASFEELESDMKRHIVPSLIHLIIPASGTLIATIIALISLNFETKLHLPMLDSPNKLGILFILTLGGINFFFSLKNKVETDNSFLSALRRIQPYS